MRFHRCVGGLQPHRQSGVQQDFLGPSLVCDTRNDGELMRSEVRENSSKIRLYGITLLSGGLSIAGIASLRKRRLFSQQPSNDSSHRTEDARGGCAPD
jgi:hypothetical protein